MPTTAFQPKCDSMKPVSQPNVRGHHQHRRRREVGERPAHRDVDEEQARAWRREGRGDGSRSRTRAPSSRAQMVMAAGSVMKEPSSGPSVRIESHQAQRRAAAEAGPPPPAPARRTPSTGRVEAMAMITTTKSGSVKCTLPRNCSAAGALRQGDHHQQRERPRCRRWPRSRRRRGAASALKLCSVSAGLEPCASRVIRGARNVWRIARSEDQGRDQVQRLGGARGRPAPGRAKALPPRYSFRGGGNVGGASRALEQKPEDGTMPMRLTRGAAATGEALEALSLANGCRGTPFRR